MSPDAGSAAELQDQARARYPFAGCPACGSRLSFVVEAAAEVLVAALLCRGCDWRVVEFRARAAARPAP